MMGGGLTVEERAPSKRSESREKYIVVAYDGSELSLKALRMAAKLVGALESRILVVHACEESKCSSELLEEAKLVLKSAGYDGEARLLPYNSAESSPASEILSLCKEVPSTMIVVGATGVSCRDFCSLGSTAASIAVNSPVPVLIVR